MRKKLIYISDSPTTPSGFGNVSRNLIRYFTKEFDVHFISIGGSSIVESRDFYFYHIPLQVYSQNFSEVSKLLFSYFQQIKPDYVFVNYDVTTFKSLFELLIDFKLKFLNKFVLITYQPIDSHLFPPDYFAPLLAFDLCIFYTEAGKKVFKQSFSTYPDSRIAVIPHGYNSQDFFIKKDKEYYKKKYFKADKDTVIIITIARNQVRKDLPTGLQIIREVIYLYMSKFRNFPKLKYYIHAAPDESYKLGWNLPQIILYFQLKNYVLLPAKFSFSAKEINEIYNAADIFLSTTLNEGYGLFVNECYATKTLLMVSDVFPMRELTNDGKFAVLLPVEKHPFFPVHRFNIPSFRADIDASAQILFEYLYNEEKKKDWTTKVEGAYQYAINNLRWDFLAHEMIRLIKNTSIQYGVLLA